MASKEIRYKEHTFKLAYEIVNSTQDEILLVLHGWGSRKEIMKQAFSNTLPDYKHIYLDMPGFGKSTNEMILTTVDYANIVQLFLDALGVSATYKVYYMQKGANGKFIADTDGWLNQAVSDEKKLLVTEEGSYTDAP